MWNTLETRNKLCEFHSEISFFVTSDTDRLECLYSLVQTLLVSCITNNVYLVIASTRVSV